MKLIEQLLGEAESFESKSQNRNDFKIFTSAKLKEMIDNSSLQISKINEKVKDNMTKTLNLEESTQKITENVLDNKIHLALLEYQRANAIVDLKDVEGSLADAQSSLKASVGKAEQFGERIAVLKPFSDVLDEIRVTDGHLASLADVSEDIERMYESYSKLYLELKEKAEIVTENRQKTLEELNVRMQTWQSVMQNLLDRVNVEYKRIMEQTLATGEVRLANAQEIETAGLEILVGFKGGKPVALDAYTQSGGERTTATMSFLLALQQHVRSPFRAVDEYDIHMDPKNREMIAKILVSIIKENTSQYIVITPSQITFAQQDANVITVQSVEGKSVVREMA